MSQERGSARGIDHHARSHARARSPRSGARHSQTVVVEIDIGHPEPFVNVGAAVLGVAKQQLVEAGARHLPGLRLRHRWREGKVNEAVHRPVGSDEGRPPFARKTGVAHDLGGTNLVDDVVDRGEQRLADVEPRKGIALEDDHPASGACQRRGRRGACRPAANDDDIAIE